MRIFKYLMKPWLFQTVVLTTCLCGGPVLAQLVIKDDFTQSSSSYNWKTFNGACLTAGDGTGSIPACVGLPYYTENLVGGYAGVSGSNQTLPDPAGNGALRFTNGNPGGYSQNGAIVSNFTFPANQGIQVSFTTVTYRGDSGGAGGDGADGISFYLMDGSKAPGIGAWGGSLAYSCSNANPPYHGLVGAYVGLGIDEYGNFLNSTNLVSGYSGGNSASADNAAYGYGYKPGRIGLRGAGSVAWSALTGAYGTNPNDSTKPYYPASLTTACVNGTYNSNVGYCASCSAGDTYVSSSNSCKSCSNGLYDPINNVCNVTNYTCASGTFKTNGQQPNMCYVCSNGLNGLPLLGPNSSGNYSCRNGGTLSFVSPTTSAGTVVPTTYAPSSSSSYYAASSVQQTCNDGVLYNYSDPANPTSAGPTTLANTVNTAKILDYAAIPYAYSELDPTLIQIANESAMKRGDAQPITYKLKITANGLLSLWYSFNGGALQTVLTGQDITASNGALPSTLRFGFAGSTGGSTNIHEITCFQAQPSDVGNSSAGINQQQTAKLQSGSQVYFAYYNPNNWAGSFTAQNLMFDTSTGIASINPVVNWDGSCVLTGLKSGDTCTSTGQTGPVAAQASSNRNILSWNGTLGIPFQWSNLTSTQQNALDLGDASNTTNRWNFLRGDRSNEVNTVGVGLYRARASVLGDIVNSSPAWVGPPSSPYPATWSDLLNPMTPADPLTENSGQTYAQYISNKQTRLNVVYVGANDGLLHGFEAGSYNSSGNYVSGGTTPNDGKEVLAYMPGAVVNTIHSTTAAVDFSNKQYGHNYFVDASPGTGDLFYSGNWHTWLVGGLGAGGAAVYALDITDPSTFSEGNAASLVMGEWSPGNISCVNVSNCSNYFGNSFGTPVIRRFHNGSWGILFGNGIGSSNGRAGVYIILIDPTTGTKSTYYLATSATTSGNGIVNATSADLDGDHVVDYIYAGDLMGNIWRFDVTSSTPSNWKASSSPLFTATGQPITTQVLAVAIPSPGARAPMVLLEFGTGQQVPFTNTAGTTYASGSQALYGVWDWNMTSWNGMHSTQYAALSSATITTLDLQSQTVTTSGNFRAVSNNVVCWYGTTVCSSNNQYGWMLTLPTSGEQIIFNPVIEVGAFIVNTTIPASNSPLTCSQTLSSGWTMAVDPATGGAFKQSFFADSNNNFSTAGGQIVSGIQLNGVGSVSIVTGTTSDGATAYNLVTQNSDDNINNKVRHINPVLGASANRLTWIEKR